ncbi:MAG: hypothetical protein ACOX4Q_09605 [Syntrophomonadales bacterium]
MVLAELKQEPVFREPELPNPRPGKKKQRTTVKKANLMLNITVFILAFSIIGISLYLHSALIGYEIVELKADIKALENENKRIEYTIAELSSLERVQVEAETKLGMFRPQSENMVALKYEPPVTAVASVNENVGTEQQSASLKRDYQVISSILHRVGITGSY